MRSKQELFDELFPLMKENGTDPDLLLTMQTPGWLDRASIENLTFLLKTHNELKAARAESAGAYARWVASKRPPE